LVSILPLSTGFFLLDFGTVPRVSYILYFCSFFLSYYL
jgi:hypothetical protein